MTNEEAIEILEANRPDSCYQMLREAVDYAVNALKPQLPSAQPKQDIEFIRLITLRDSNGRPYYSIIYLEFDDNGVGHECEGYSSYSLDVISDYLKRYFMPSAQPEREKGYWIDKTDPEWDGEWGDWQCPHCGAMIMSMAINLNGVYLYCPKCGERVDGER